VPKAAPEPPPVADAQIAIEKAKRDAAKREAAEREEQRQLALKREAQKAEAQKLEAQRAEARQQELQRQKAQREKALAEAQEAEERRKKELAEKARKEEATLVAQREANLKRIQGQANATGDADSAGTAARTSGPSASYAGRIKARIKPNIVFTDGFSGNPLATGRGALRVRRHDHEPQARQEQRQRRLGRRGAARDRQDRDAAARHRRPRAAGDADRLQAARLKATNSRSMRSFQRPIASPSTDQPCHSAIALPSPHAISASECRCGR
jgi:hypothetical protein